MDIEASPYTLICCMGRNGDERLRGLRHRRLAEPPSHYSIVPFVPQQPGAEGHLAWLQAILAGGGKSGNRRVFGRIVCGDSHGSGVSVFVSLIDVLCWH